MRTKSCRVGIRISEETRKRIEDSGKNISEYIREMLEGNVEHNVEQGEVDKLHQHIAELEGEIGDLKFALSLSDNSYELTEDADIALRDILQMMKVSVGEEQVADLLRHIQGAMESGEYLIEGGELKLNHSEVFDVLNTEEVSSALSRVWDACDTRGRTYQEGLKCVFLKGAEAAEADIYGDKR